MKLPLAATKSVVRIYELRANDRIDAFHLGGCIDGRDGNDYPPVTSISFQVAPVKHSPRVKLFSGGRPGPAAPHLGEKQGTGWLDAVIERVKIAMGFLCLQ
jgi:hypothetical protein